MQCEALVQLNRILIKKGLSIISYSGYTLDELLQLQNPYVKKMLSQLDILIDGRYQQENTANLLWRGSRNQNVHFLTDRYNDYKQQVNSGGEIELIIGNDKITYTGILQDEILKKLHDMIK